MPETTKKPDRGFYYLDMANSLKYWLKLINMSNITNNSEVTKNTYIEEENT